MPDQIPGMPSLDEPDMTLVGLRKTISGLHQVATQFDEMGMPEAAFGNRYAAKQIALLTTELNILREASNFPAERIMHREVAVRKVISAWKDSGNNPNYHFNQIRLLKQRWPTLVTAILKLIETRES